MVCVDETSKQLISETRVPIKLKPGQPARQDYEYERNGTVNLFMMFAPLEGWRHVAVTDRHTAVDFAQMLKICPIRISPQPSGSCSWRTTSTPTNQRRSTKPSPPAEARRLVERFEWHYTPKHGSWLTMAEAELHSSAARVSVKHDAKCLGRRIARPQPSSEAPSEEIATIEGRHDRRPPQVQIQTVPGYTRQHRGAPLLCRKSLSQKNFRHLEPRAPT